MVSSDEESEDFQPAGFSLNISKYNNARPAKSRLHYGSTTIRSRPYPPVRKETDSGVGAQKHCSDGTKKLSVPSSRTTRKHVLASISANARRKQRIPIPSFQMMKSSKDNDSDMKKLSKLERAFFDEDQTDDEMETEHDNHSQTDNINEEGFSSKNSANDETKNKSAAIYPPEQQEQQPVVSSSSSVSEKSGDPDPPRMNSNDLSIIVEEDSEETDSEHSGFGKGSPLRLRESDADRRPRKISKASGAQEPETTAAKVVDKDDKSVLKESRTHPYIGHTRQEKVGFNSRKETDGQEETDANDSNGFDFCDGDDNDQPVASTNDNGKTDSTTIRTDVSTTTTQPMEPCQQQASISHVLNLDVEIDRLFAKSDPNTITLKIFCKTLEARMDSVLDKATKKKVRARVMSLLRGEINPSSEVVGTNQTSETHVVRLDAANVAEIGTTETNSSKDSKTTLSEKGSKGDYRSTMDVLSMIETQQVMDVSSDVKQTHEAETNREKGTRPNRPTEEDTRPNRDSQSIMETQPRMETKRVILNLSSETHVRLESNLASDKNKTVESSKLDLASNVKTKPSMETTNDIIVIDDESGPGTTEKMKETTIDNGILTEQKKLNKAVGKPKSGARKAREPKPNPAQEANSNESSNTSKPTSKQPKAKRPRKTAPKASSKEETTGATSTKTTRKRPRTTAAACALCKTCPCQRKNTNENGTDTAANLDMMKTFSRSHGAIEKTLMRRLQKLEQSTESLEEQTEVVRRRLKKHRREQSRRNWKIKFEASQGIATNRTADSYFLPDAEVLERDQIDYQGMSKGVVEKAQTRVFQNVPTYQPTLFEMMGIPRDDDKTKETNGDEKNDTKEGKSKCEQGTNDGCKEKPHVENYDDDDIPTEYVPERECNDKINRLEWNNGARDDEDNEETGVSSGSIFDTILMMTQDERGSNNVMIEEKVRPPLWDDLFEAKQKERSADANSTTSNEAGLDDLLGLFGDEIEDCQSNENEIGNGELKSDEGPAEVEGECIDASLLSQGAQVVAKEVVSSVSSRDHTSLLLQSCPNWKENVYFALMQKDTEEIQKALENVRESRMRMEVQKKRILNAWESKNAALEVFETALKRSAERLVNNFDAGPAEDCMNLTQIEEGG